MLYNMGWSWINRIRNKSHRIHNTAVNGTSSDAHFRTDSYFTSDLNIQSLNDKNLKLLVISHNYIYCIYGKPLNMSGTEAERFCDFVDIPAKLQSCILYTLTQLEQHSGEIVLRENMYSMYTLYSARKNEISNF